MAVFESSDIPRVEAYLQTTFGNERITIIPREKAKDSVEVHINGEFIGVVYKDVDEGETSYDFNMAILEMDLPKTNN